MGFNISIDTQQIINASNAIRNNASELETAVNNVSTIIGNIQEGWVGANANDFSARIQSFKNTKLSKAVNALNSTAEALKVSGETTGTTQEQIKMKIANLGMISSSVSGVKSGNFIDAGSLYRNSFEDPNLKFVKREDGVVDIIRKDDVTGEDVIIGRTTEENIVTVEPEVSSEETNLTDKGYPSSTEGSNETSSGGSNLTDKGYPSSTEGSNGTSSGGSNLTDRGYPSSTEGSNETSSGGSNLTDRGYPSSTEGSSGTSSGGSNLTDRGYPSSTEGSSGTSSGGSNLTDRGYPSSTEGSTNNSQHTTVVENTVPLSSGPVDVVNSDISFSEAIEGRLDIDVSKVDTIKRDGWGALNDFSVGKVDTLKYNADTGRYDGYAAGAKVSSYSINDLENAWID